MLVASLVLGVAVIGAAIAVFAGRDSRELDPEPPLRPVDERLIPTEGPWAEFYEAYSAEPTRPAALVNGRPVYAYQLVMFRLMRDSGLVRTDTAPPTDGEFLESLIEEELLYQEAVRRQLTPSDEEVMDAIRQIQEETLRGLANPAPEYDELRALMAEVEGTVFHVRHYDESPWIFRTTRRQMAASRLYEELVRTDPVVQEHGLEGLAAKLRERAKVEVLVSLPD